MRLVDQRQRVATIRTVGRRAALVPYCLTQAQRTLRSYACPSKKEESAKALLRFRVPVGRSAWRPGERAASEDMAVEMGDRFARVRAIVDDQPVSALNQA